MVIWSGAERPSWGPDVGTAFAGDDGRFELHGLRERRYSATFYATGYLDLDRVVDVTERHVGRGVDAVLVVDAPVLVEPAVEGSEEHPDRLDVLLDELLVEHPQGGEQPHRRQALAVEGGDPGVAVHVLGGQGLTVAEVVEGGIGRALCRERV